MLDFIQHQMIGRMRNFTLKQKYEDIMALTKIELGWRVNRMREGFFPHSCAFLWCCRRFQMI